MKFKLKNGQSFEAEGIKGILYNSKEDYPAASAQYIEVNGRSEKVRCLTSDRIYYVIEGEGEFMVNGQIYSVKTSDVIIVPRTYPHNFWGTMNLFAVHTPAFDPGSEEKLEGIKEGIKKIRVRISQD